MKIGILQTGRAPAQLHAPFGDYDALFRQMLDGMGFEFDTYPVMDMVLPGAIEAADGWLVTGSPHGVYEDHPWIPPLETFIRDVAAARIPMVGICFGHQIIAQAMGGRAEKFAGGWTIGPQMYRSAEFGPLTLNAMHQDQVTKAPPGARVIGTTATCANAMLRYDAPILTMQPHPEMTPAFFAGLVDTREEILPEDAVAAARGAADTPLDNDRTARIIADHLKGHADG